MNKNGMTVFDNSLIKAVDEKMYIEKLTLEKAIKLVADINDVNYSHLDGLYKSHLGMINL